MLSRLRRMEHGPRLASRLAGALLALSVGLQSGAAIAIPGARVANCCCKPQDASVKCHCPSCTHGRELEAGNPVLKSCGGGTDLKAVALSPAPVLVGTEDVLLEQRRQAAPPAVPERLNEPPDLDVDTPPPLA
jgi:hypothetical protein